MNPKHILNHHQRYCRRYYLSHLEEHKERCRKYRVANREKIREKKKQSYLANRDEIRARQKAYNLANRDKRRHYMLSKTYGMSLLEFNSMAEHQKGLCAICGELPGRKGLSTDHCHINGIIRGLLCSKCNTGLGYFRDDPALLVRAIDYLVPQPIKLAS